MKICTGRITRLGILAIFAGGILGVQQITGNELKLVQSQTSNQEEELEKKEITILASGQKGMLENNTEELEKAFPNMTIHIERLPDEQFYATLKLQLVSDNKPDIIQVQGGYAGVNSVKCLAELGYLEPLTELDIPIMSDENLRKNLSYKGEIYAVGNGQMNLGTYYHKDIFDKYGLEVPTNWKEFLNCCKILKENGVIPITMGDKDSFVTQYGLYQIAANVIYNEQPEYNSMLWNGTGKFTDSGTWDQVIAKYKKLYDLDYIDEESLQLGSLASRQKFKEGEAAMTFGIIAKSELGENNNSDVGYFPLPANKKGVKTNVICATVGGGLAINSKSQYKEECKAILKYLYQDSTISSKSDTTQIYQEEKEQGRAYDVCNRFWPAGTEDMLAKKFLECISGRCTVKEVTKSIQEKFDSQKVIYHPDYEY